MESVLVDTDVFSDLFKGNTYAHHFAPLLEGKEMFISATTVGELEFWALRRGWGASKQRSLRRLLDGVCILPADRAVAERYALIRDHVERTGRPMGPNDTWIAATALTHHLALATRNKSDFGDVPELVLI